MSECWVRLRAAVRLRGCACAAMLLLTSVPMSIPSLKEVAPVGMTKYS